MTEIKVPVLPESVADATIAKWYKKPGDAIKRNENLVDIETDKVMLEVPAPEDGVLQEIVQAEGATVTAQQVIGILTSGGVVAKSTEKSAEETSKAEAKPVAEATKAAEVTAGPAVRRLAGEHDVDLHVIKGSGKEGRVTKEDVQQHVQKASTTPVSEIKVLPGERPEKRVPMTRLRARIAERLVEAQHSAAMLTTFNEVNLKPVSDIRQKYKDDFQKKHGVKLGFMSFFIKAAVEALKRYPVVNASIDGTDVIYHGYFDISVAVSTDRGLVVPVIRNADQLSLAELEKQVAVYGEKARDNKLSIEEMTGGTFTISNGGVFGSLLSTPIINPPQSAILGMHKIEDRPVVENGQIVIRPMMYLAMSYDHRIVDGRDSVTFLRTIKELLEDPSRILLDL
ncbi:MAG: 2-oxoglutarate dehydrogenase complex dihydrolipoyllysine-residue succinyltransferase [Gammaproteobacteria bacterium]